MISAVRRFSLLALLYTGAVLTAIGPPLGAFSSEFISTGLPGFGEAASGDHLQAAYRFWLVGHQLLGGHAPWIDPYSFQPLVDPQVVFGGWPFGLAFWPLDALFGPVLAWNLLLVLVAVGCGLLTYAWLEELDLPPWSAALGGLAFAVAPLPARPERPAPARVGRPLPAAGASRGRALPPRFLADRRARMGWGCRTRARIDPAQWTTSSRARRTPVRARLRARSLPRHDCDLGGRGGAGRRRRRPARQRDDDRRLDRGGRAPALRGRHLLGGLARPREPRTAWRLRAVRLPRLADAAPCQRRASCCWRAAAAHSRCCSGSGPSSPFCSPSARTFRSTSSFETPCRLSGGRACPGGWFRSPTWLWPPWRRWRLRSWSSGCKRAGARWSRPLWSSSLPPT